MFIFLIFIGLTLIFISSSLLLFKDLGSGLIGLLALLWCLPFILSWCFPFMSHRRTSFWGILFTFTFFLGLLTLMLLTTETGRNIWYSCLNFLGLK